MHSMLLDRRVHQTIQRNEDLYLLINVAPNTNRLDRP